MRISKGIRLLKNDSLGILGSIITVIVLLVSIATVLMYVIAFILGIIYAFGSLITSMPNLEEYFLISMRGCAIMTLISLFNWAITGLIYYIGERND